MADSRAALLHGTALQAVALLVIALPAQAQLAPTARPQGGLVVAGQAGISQTGTVTTVQQASPLAAVTWQSFSVGSAETVNFRQPGAGATTLNRVVGPDPSAIAGRITANGNVVLVNGSGVVFEKGSQVDVNSLVVSTADISTKNFMAGNTDFSIPGKPDAMVVNRGSITVKQSGLAALVAPAVVNQGVITARMGRVALAGATAYTVDLYGDGLLAIDVTGQVQQVPAGRGGQPAAALVTNTGTILAQGGTIALTAAAADGVVTNLVTAGGKISADGGRGQGGSIVLGGIGGSLVVQGEVSARGATGGSVQAFADAGVTVASTAKIDVSGRYGGGTVALGTTLARAAGRPALAGAAPVARTLTVAQGATVTASATRQGNGGLVDLSGTTVSLTGSIDVAATAGGAGTVLLDPATLSIVHGPVGSPNIGANAITDGKINGLGATILLQASDSIAVARNVTIALGAGLGFTLEAGNSIALVSGVRIAAGSDILLATGNATAFPGGEAPAIQLNGATLTSGGNLYLLAGAGGSVGIGATGVAQAANGTVSIVADSLAVTAGAAVTGATLQIAPATPGSTVSLGGGATGLVIDATMLGVLGGFATLSVGAAATPSATTITAGSIAVAGAVNAGGNTLALYSTGDITETTGALTAGTLTGSAGANVSLADTNAGSAGTAVPGNQITTLANFGAGGDFVLQTGGAGLSVAGVVTAGTAAAAGVSPNLLDIRSAGLLSIPGALTSGTAGAGFRGGNVVLEAGGPAAPGAGSIAITGSVTAVPNGTGGTDSITATAGAISLSGTLRAGSDATHETAGLITLQGETIASTGLISGSDLDFATLAVSGGSIVASRALTVGTGTGMAGTASGSASSGGFSQSGGVVLAAGNATVWSTGALTQNDGTLAAGGTLAVTAASLSQGMGGAGAALLSGAQAVRLYAIAGDARQGDHGMVAGAGGLAAGDGIAIQAPAGDNSFWHFAPAGALAAGVLTNGAAAGAGGAGDVLLAGSTITLFGDSAAAVPVLAAGTLWLFSLHDTTEQPGAVIDAVTVAGNAGFVAAPAWPGGLQAPGGWTQTAGSNAWLGTLTAGGATTAETIGAANLIQTLGPYSATGTLSLTNAAPALTVAGPVQATGTITLAAAGAMLSVAGSVRGGGVLLVANENLTNTGAALTVAPASLDIGGTVLAPGGTITLRSETDIAETGTLVAATVTGRAGELAADTSLPTNERADLPGSATLTGTVPADSLTSSNDIGTVPVFLATGSLTLFDSPVTAGTLSLAGPVAAGYGALVAAPALAVQVGDTGAGTHGALAVTGQVAVGSATATQGSAILTATGNIAFASAIDPATGQTDALIFAPGMVTVAPGSALGAITVANAGATYTQSGGVIAGGGVVIGAPGGATIGGNAIVVATAAPGISFAPVISGSTLASTATLNSGLIMAAGAMSGPAITFGTLQQASGTISANGDLLVQGSAVQAGAGLIVASGNAIIGTAASGLAGHGGSAATGSAGTSFAGTLLVAGNVDLRAGGTLVQSGGVIAAGGHVWATAGQGIVQSGGTISAAGTSAANGGIMLLAGNGSAIQDTGAVLAAAGTAPVIVQAPQGNNDFATVSIAGTLGFPAPGTASVTCPACVMPLTGPLANAQVTTRTLGGLAAPALTGQAASPAAAPRVDVTLLGGTITIDKPLIAGALSLYAGGTITETGNGTIDALVLQVGAGVPANGTLSLPDALGWPGLPAGWTGGQTGSAILTTLSNSVSNTGGAAFATIVLQDSAGLTVDNMTAGAAATLTAPAITVSGTLTAPVVTLMATAGTLDLTGMVNAGVSASLSGSAGIAGAAGAVTGGGTLTAISSAGAVTLSNPANVISRLASLAATGSAALLDATSLLVNGPVTVAGPASTLLVQAGTGNAATNLILQGAVLHANDVTLLAPGTIDGTTGTIIAHTLTLPGAGTAVASAQRITLGSPDYPEVLPTNSIDILNPVTSQGLLLLTDAVPLQLPGGISAPAIQIGAAGSLEVASGATLTTGYQPLPLVQQSQPPQDSNGVAGLNLAILNGAGTIELGAGLTILGTAGAAQQTMRLALPGGGLIRFGNFDNPGTDLLLQVGAGSARSVSGTIDVGALSAFYLRGSSGTIDLTGIVGGQTASGAASISRTGQEPAVPAAFAATTDAAYVPGAAYQVNQCPIASVNCMLLSAVQAPPPLRKLEFSFTWPQDELDDPDLLLPYISDRDN
jgi:filamentous hemagglutinin family protein